MGYLARALTGIGAGAMVGGVAGFALMLWGPGSGDPLAGLWVFVGIFAAVPAGLIVGLALAWGTRNRRFPAGSFLKPALLGAAVTIAAIWTMLTEEALDEWYNLPIFGVMGALTGIVTSVVSGASARPQADRNHDP